MIVNVNVNVILKVNVNVILCSDLTGTVLWINLPQKIQKTNKKKTNSLKSTITMLPLIDLNPSDESCIYSTLIKIIEQAKYLNYEIPCVT